MTRILQLSDPHVVPLGERAYGVVDTGAYLERAVKAIAELLGRIGPVDHLVVSGDVAEAGLASEYRRFLDVVGALDLPLAVVPGNHDDREVMRSVLGALPSMPTEGPVAWRIPFEDFDMIGIDTLVQGSPHGHLSEQDLLLLDAHLDEAAGRPLLVVAHHPPFEAGISHMDRQRLINGEALLERLRPYPAAVTLACGHVHRFMVRPEGRHLLMIAPAPSHAVTLDHSEDAVPNFHLEPPGALLHEWRGVGSDAAILTQFIPLGSFAGPYKFFPGDQGTKR